MSGASKTGSCRPSTTRANSIERGALSSLKRCSVTALKRQTICAFAVLLLSATSGVCFGAESEAPPADYFAGKYELIGRRAGSTETYAGSVELQSQSDGKFVMIRRIGGHEIKGTASIEQADPPADHPAVLRIRFTEAGHEFEGTFLWRSDLDNYPRLTGLISQVGKAKSAGLEAWFAAPQRR